MKKILIVSDSLDCHGAAKSLVNFLSCIDKSTYEVDLFLFWTFDPQFELPEGVNILPADKGLEAYFMPIQKSMCALMKWHKWTLLFYRFYNYCFSTPETRTFRLYKSWKKMLPSFSTLPGKYDLAISYQDNLTSSFVLEKITADHYVIWNHNPVETFGVDMELFRRTICKFDKVVTVSDQAKKTLVKNIGAEIAQKVIVFPNLQNEKEIVEKSKVTTIEQQYLDDKRFKILSVGRLAEQKGFDFALDTAKALKEAGCIFSWYIIGEGNERKKLETMIDHYHLQNTVILLGQKKNPYAYMARCDLYTQPSRWEAEGITVREAIILRKCVVGSPVTANGLTDGRDLMVVPLLVDAWEKKLEELINSPEIVTEFCIKMGTFNMSSNTDKCDKLLQQLMSET